MTKKTNIKLVYLNNKTRQGWYIYKRAKGKSHYYKKREGITEKETIKFYNRKKNWHKDLGKKKARTYGEIEEQIAKGIQVIMIESPQTINNAEIQRKKEELLRNTVKNKKILKLITTEHNMEKIKHRFEYTIQVKDNKNELLASATKTNETIEEAIKATKEIVIGEETDMIGTSPSIKRLREKHGWTTMTHKDGTIANISLRITFRKG